MRVRFGGGGGVWVGVGVELGGVVVMLDLLYTEKLQYAKQEHMQN